jgi:AcrR family transcriptional regulator
LPPAEWLAQHPEFLPEGMDTRTRLLVAAIELVKSQGIQALTQARVARAAGLRQSHLTYHFPTRSHLLAAVALHSAADTLRCLGETPAEQSPTLDEFRSRMAEHVSTSAMPRLMLALILASEEDPSLKSWMTTFEERARAQLACVFESFGLRAPAIEIALFHAALVGMSTLQIATDSPDSAGAARDLLFHAFDRLVAASAPMTGE